MTEQHIIQEFRSYPKVKKSQVVRQLLQILEEDLEETPPKENELSIEEKRTIVENLRGIAAVKGTTPPTDEEIKSDYTNYLIEKYK